MTYDAPPGPILGSLHRPMHCANTVEDSEDTKDIIVRPLHVKL
jgi:hypothetical protein